LITPVTISAEQVVKHPPWHGLRTSTTPCTHLQASDSPARRRGAGFHSRTRSLFGDDGDALNPGATMLASVATSRGHSRRSAAFPCHC